MKTRHRAAQRAQTSKSRSGSSLRRTSTKTTAPTTHHAPPSTARRRGSRHAASPRTRPTSTEREAGKSDLMTACASHPRASPDDDDRNLILTKSAETAFLGIPVAKKLVAPKKKQSLYMATPPVATQCYKTSQAPLYAANRPARTKKQTSAAIDPGARSPGGVAGVQLTPVNTKDSYSQDTPTISDHTATFRPAPQRGGVGKLQQIRPCKSATIPRKHQ